MNQHVSNDEKAKNDALSDIADDAESDQLQLAFIGHVLLSDENSTGVSSKNVTIYKALSYEEAVGIAFLELREKLEKEPGLFILNLDIEENPVWVERLEE